MLLEAYVNTKRVLLTKWEYETRSTTESLSCTYYLWVNTVKFSPSQQVQALSENGNIAQVHFLQQVRWELVRDFNLFQT